MTTHPSMQRPGGGSRATLRERLEEARRPLSDEAHPSTRRPTASPSWLEQLGLSPRLTLVLAAVAGVAVVAGLSLTLTAPRDNQAQAAEPPEAGPPPTLMPAARPLAEEAVEDYIILLRQGMYDVAWERTTVRFQQENYPEGLGAYQQAWEAVGEVEVVSKKVVWRSDDAATVVAELHELASETSYRNSYQLIFDGASGLWQIDRVDQLW